MKTLIAIALFHSMALASSQHAADIHFNQSGPADSWEVKTKVNLKENQLFNFQGPHETQPKPMAQNLKMKLIPMGKQVAVDFIYEYSEDGRMTIPLHTKVITAYGRPTTKTIKTKSEDPSGKEVTRTFTLDFTVH